MNHTNPLLDSNSKQYKKVKQKGFNVEAMPRKGFPYDIKAKKGDKELHVEVKGLSGKLQKIQLTWKEYEYCISHPKNSVLYVLSEIKCAAPTKKRKKWKCSNAENTRRQL